MKIDQIKTLSRRKYWANGDLKKFEVIQQIELDPIEKQELAEKITALKNGAENAEEELANFIYFLN